MRKHEPSLYQHSLRVGALADDFYRYRGLSYLQGWQLVEGALLHDLGKISLPASLLLKAKGLDDAERRMMALHPNFGADLLEAQNYFSKVVVNIVRRHHERLDGSGYPDGWRVQRTAKSVRIVAVCDAFCAMTEDRPYEDAWPWPDALDRLRSMPRQYDADVVSDLGAMIQERRTTIQLRQGAIGERTRMRVASGVQRPRSAFFAPRFRNGMRVVH